MLRRQANPTGSFPASDEHPRGLSFDNSSTEAECRFRIAVTPFEARSCGRGIKKRSQMAADCKMKNGLLVVTLGEHMTSAELFKLMSSADKLEQEQSETPDRLTDFSAVDHLDLDFRRMLSLTDRRNRMTLKNQIKSAIVAPKPMQFGFARMFETLLTNPKIELRIFRDFSTALLWLGEKKIEKINGHKQPHQPPAAHIRRNVE
jgi:hypothetical protein